MAEHRQPAFDETPRAVAPGIDPRRFYAVVGILVGVIVLLLVRPWGDGRPSARETTAAVMVGPRATPTQAAVTAASAAASMGSPIPVDSYAGLWVTCGSPSGWRAATIQSWPGREAPIRSWIAIEPVLALGPLDPGIPFAPVATEHVFAIGYCSPLDDQLRPPETAQAALWAARDGQAISLTRVPLEPMTPNALGGLWRPAPEVVGVEGGDAASAWPPGRYVIEVVSPGGSYDRWLGIEIEDLARLRAAGPSPTPGSPQAAPLPTPGPSVAPGGEGSPSDAPAP